MANLTLVAGAQADIVSGAELSTVHGELGGKLDRLLARGGKPSYLDWALAGQAAAGLPTTIIFDGPSAGKVWDLRQLVINGGDDSAALSTLASSVATAATVGSNVVLPAGAAITGFDFESAPQAVPVGDIITITNAVAGTLRYEVSYSANGFVLSKSFPRPIPALSAASVITLTAPATAGGSAYTLTIYGTAQGSWFKTQASYIASPSAAAPQLLVPRQDIPALWLPPSAQSVYLHYGELLVAQVYGAPAGTNVVGIARIAEWSDGDTERRIL